MNWIRLYVSPYPWIVIPEVVVVEIGLAVEVLPRQPQVARKVPQPRGVFIGDVPPEGIRVVPPPDGLTDLVRNQPRRVQMIGVS